MNVKTLPIESIQLDPNQARKLFDKDKLEGLARSIEEVGLLHPVIVKPVESGYRLVAGERRLHAAKRLGEAQIPAIVLGEGRSHRQVQLVENLQREDLNPVERAVAISEFMKSENLSKQAAAERLGVPRTTLTDWLDVLDVDERYQRAVIDNFYGGDSPLTLAHVAEAKAFGVRMKSERLQNALLDAVLTHKLSKGEVRRVTSIVRSNPDVSIAEAIEAIRRPVAEEENKGEEKKAKDRPSDPVGQNMERLFGTLERSRKVLGQLGHVSPGYLPEEDRTRLITDLRELYELIGSVIHRIETGGDVPRSKKVRKRLRKENKAS